jgi:hypothetical protein
MNRYVKKMGLLVGASTFALGVFAFAPANAFDDVDWTWTATVTETVTKDVIINIDIDPTGMVMLEDLQIQVGDVTATSTVSGIYNNHPTGGTNGGSTEVDLGSITLDADYGLGGGFLPGGTAEGDVVDGTVTSGTVDETDVPPDVNGNVTAVIDLGTITVEQDPVEGVEFDALTELPEVISAATAVGNNTSIETDAAVQLHEAQLLVGSIEYPSYGEDWDGGIDVLGLSITPASITATSTVYNILNASVDSSATAVGNNLTVDIEAVGDDRLLMADVAQISVANVSATSTVYDVRLYDYINLGAIDRPIVNSVATAVGNNKSISVSAPDVDTDPGGSEP